MLGLWEKRHEKCVCDLKEQKKTLRNKNKTSLTINTVVRVNCKEKKLCYFYKTFDVFLPKKFFSFSMIDLAYGNLNSKTLHFPLKFRGFSEKISIEIIFCKKKRISLITFVCDFRKK